MSERFDSYLASVGIALSKGQIDLDRANAMLSVPEVINEIDGSNIQQLIRVSLMMSAMGEEQPSFMTAEVGLLLSMIRPELEIDFGLATGVSTAQSCSLFAMHCIALRTRNIPLSLSVLEPLTSSLNAAKDWNGLLEAMCWQGVLSMDIGDFARAADHFSIALAFLGEPQTIDALQDNSALDMVRADNINVFSFPRLEFLQSGRPSEIEKEIRALLSASEARRSDD
jgi:hypothetical protein